MTYEDILAQVQAKYYAEVPFGLTSVDMQQAAESFLEFLTLPQETKQKLHFKVDPLSKRTDVGYLKYHVTLGHHENKEYFHYHALWPERFASLGVVEDARITRFLDHAQKVFDAASRSLSDTMQALESAAPGIHAKMFPSDTFPSFFLRFLKYDVRDGGEFLARAHYDGGDMTLALSESAPGLRIGSSEADLKEVPPRKSGTAVFMPGLTFREIAPGRLDQFVPAWHDVIQKSDLSHSSDVARWAIVFFADTFSENRIAESDTHTVTK